MISGIFLNLGGSGVSGFMAPTDTPPLAVETELEREPKIWGLGSGFRLLGV